MLMPRHRPKARRFHYEPRFYDPTEDERQKRRFRITSNVRRGRQPAFIAVAVVLLIAFYIFTKL